MRKRNQKAQEIIELRNTIDPDTEKVYTVERIAEMKKVSKQYVSSLTNPQNADRRKRRSNMRQVIESRFAVIAGEDWGEAYALLGRLRAILKERTNV